MIPRFLHIIGYCFKISLIVLILFAEIAGLHWIFDAWDYNKNIIKNCKLAMEAILRRSWFNKYDAHGIKHWWLILNNPYWMTNQNMMEIQKLELSYFLLQTWYRTQNRLSCSRDNYNSESISQVISISELKFFIGPSDQ